MGDADASRWRATYAGSATVLVEVPGLRVVTDPVLDPPGEPWRLNRRLHGPEWRYTALTAPALTPADLGAVDVVLLSHDQHRDNLDRAGLELARRAGCVLTTPLGALRLRARGVPGARGLEAGEHVDFAPAGVRVTAVPARHGPTGTNWLTGPVTGFVVEGPGAQRLYVTGDTVWFDGLRAVQRYGPIDTLFVHLGAARFGGGWLRRCAHWSFDAREAVRLVQALEPRSVVPIHMDGWSHFTQGLEDLRRELRAVGLARVLRPLPRGQMALL
jgi:L-ascorbate metabolism protein UlaG (beta-lactamase superfamily)